MNDKQVQEEIVSRVEVSRQNIVIAKSFILSNFNPSPTKMLTRLLEHLQIQRLEKFVLHESVPPEPQIKQVATVISWQLAFVEALWGLIGAGLVFPFHRDLMEIPARQDWTTIVQLSGGYSADWRFKEYDVAVPNQVRLAPSLQNQSPQLLTDPDIYLAHLDIADIHPEVRDALTQAVECFRHGLYLPSVAMLGLASEGAWIELGLSLLKVSPSHPGLTAEKRDNHQDKLTSYYTSVLQKLEIVADLYRKKEIYEEVARRSGFNHRSLNQVLNWSNVIRDSRNAIHYGSDAASQNTYEKVAALLLGAGPNLQIIYSIRRAAEELS